jgi:hypothetical protein
MLPANEYLLESSADFRGASKMAMPVVSIRYENPPAYIYSPFSGLPAVTEEDGENKDDPTLLFTWVGNAGVYGYISLRLQDLLDQNLEDIEDINIDDLPSLLNIDGGLILAVDEGFNGVNYYGFAPLTKPTPIMKRRGE